MSEGGDQQMKRAAIRKARNAERSARMTAVPGTGRARPSDDGSEPRRFRRARRHEEPASVEGEAVALIQQVACGSVEEGEGLRAIAKGMNALSRSDAEMVERMAPVFDAIYAYCERRVAGNRGWANAEPTWGASPDTGK